MDIVIRFYAALKDYFQPEEVYSFQEGDRVETLKKCLVEKNPHSENLLNICRIAVNEHIVDEKTVLSKNDTVDILPPSSGG